jgi:hypothetical protein
VEKRFYEINLVVGVVNRVSPLMGDGGRGADGLGVLGAFF